MEAGGNPADSGLFLNGACVTCLLLISAYGVAAAFTWSTFSQTPDAVKFVIHAEMRSFLSGNLGW